MACSWSRFMLRLEDRLEAPCAVLKSRDITWVQKEIDRKSVV